MNSPHANIELRRALRMTRAKNRLGEDARCEVCGDTHLVHLARTAGRTLCGCCLAVRRGREIFERHHIAGHREGRTIRVCANCHAELTDRQRDWPPGLGFDERFALGLSDIEELRWKGEPR